MSYDISQTAVCGIDSGVEFTVECRLALATLRRPEKRNALSRATLERLEAIQSFLKNNPRIRAVIVAAEGAVFSSGHDLGELATANERDAATIFSLCSRVMLGWRELPQAVIAKVQGPATAAGCQLVAACDLAVAAANASFATPGVKIGLFCGTPMVPLVRAIAPRAALEMLLTGLPISAARALELGLVNRVVAPEDLDAETRALAAAVIAAPAALLAAGKRVFYQGLALAEAPAYERATEFMTQAVGKPEAREGIRAFLEKRAPHWHDE